MDKICSKDICTGCGVCTAVCPTRSITMKLERGFFYPRIEPSSCVDCGLCAKKCPARKETKAAHVKSVIAAQNTDNKIRNISSSGGLFTALALQILKEKGVVFGAYQQDALHVRHLAVETAEGLGLLRGSKYVQSDAAAAYPLVKEFLKQKRKVLFVGLPCQIYGLYASLNAEETDTLLTADLVCHGTISYDVMRSYLEENKLDIAGSMVDYRNKATGWHNYSISVKGRNCRESSACFNQSDFGKVFIKNYFLRESCYRCKMKTDRSMADLTIGDFWGIENRHPEMDDNAGTSVVVVHTPKGSQALNQIKDTLNCCESTFEAAAEKNFAMSHAAETKVNQEKLYSLLYHSGLQAVVKAHCKPKFRTKIKAAVKKALLRLGKR